MAEYNYPIFDGSPAQGDFDAFTNQPHVGEKAPDGILTDMDGNPVALSSLWRANHLMVEFGSFT